MTCVCMKNRASLSGITDKRWKLICTFSHVLNYATKTHFANMHNRYYGWRRQMKRYNTFPMGKK